MSSTAGNVCKSVKVTQLIGNLTQFSLRKSKSRILPLIVFSFCIIVATSAAETNFAVIKSFGNREAALHSVREWVIEGSDGLLYGVASKGIVRLSKDGTEIETVHQFHPLSSLDQAFAGVIEGSDGKLYGTTWETVYRVEKNGTGFEILHHFQGGTNDGYECSTGVIEGRDRRLYGCTELGGAFGGGVVFGMERDGGGYRVLQNLNASTGWSLSVLTDGGDGHLYGIFLGVDKLVRINKDTGELTTLHSFSDPAGAQGAIGPLVISTEGVLYGTTRWTDTTNGGCIYRVRTDGSDFVILKKFLLGELGGLSPTGLHEGKDGLFYGTTSGDTLRTHSGTVFKIRKDGTDFALLHTFDSTNGASPSSPFQASDGLLYGMTFSGGETTACDRGDGVIYRLRPDGSNFQVVKFLDRTGGEGVRPKQIIQGKDGMLYGTTSEGGRSNTTGVVYRLNANGGGYSQLFTFSAVGGLPPTDLTEGNDEFLYTTVAQSTTGAVVRIPKLGGETPIIASFIGRPLGIVQGADNRLYVCLLDDPGENLGTIISMQPDGSDYRIVRSFRSTERGYPGKLIQGSDGWLYGLKRYFGRELIFKLHPDGTGFATLHASHPYLGYPPFLIEGADGFLYGTTIREGTSENTVFRIAKDGSSYALFDLSTVIYSLAEGVDGMLYGIGTGGDIFRIGKDGQRYRIIWHDLFPVSLISGADSIYFTTHYGGDMNWGSVIRFIPPPDINISRASNVVHLTAEGLQGRPLGIETSPDYVTWTPMGPTSISGRLTVEDTNTFGTKRFYRAVLGPQP